jgi:hypothetical protein
MLPNFLIIGAAKSGTTSLYRYLGQHPQIYANVKEPSFFAFEGQRVHFAGPGDQHGLVRRMVTNLDAYQALFKDVKDEVAYGEASVIYLYHPKAAVRIKHYIPEVKLIAILRNPVERAFSSYAHLRRDGREPLANFAEALRAEDSRIAANWEHQWHYTRLGFYYTQLKRYYDLFSPEQIAVYTYDEFKAQPLMLVTKIFRFLGIDSTFQPDTSVKYNVSGKPKSRTIHSFLIKPNRVKDLVRPILPRSTRRYLGKSIKEWNIDAAYPELKAEIREQFSELYRDEILMLQSLIQQDLSCWLHNEYQFGEES